MNNVGYSWAVRGQSALGKMREEVADRGSDV